MPEGTYATYIYKFLLCQEDNIKWPGRHRQSGSDIKDTSNILSNLIFDIVSYCLAMARLTSQPDDHSGGGGNAVRRVAHLSVLSWSRPFIIIIYVRLLRFNIIPIERRMPLSFILLIFGSNYIYSHSRLLYKSDSKSNLWPLE